MTKKFAVVACWESGGKTAYLAGQKAYKENQEIRNNPHVRHSFEWEQWRLGYLRQMVRANEEKR